MTTRKQVLKLDIRQVKNLMNYYYSKGKYAKAKQCEVELDILKKLLKMEVNKRKRGGKK